MDANSKIFDTKTFDSLLKDIYSNSVNKSRHLNRIIDDLRDACRVDGKLDMKKASEIYPIIQDYYETSIRNDSHLVSLATIAQRIMIAEMKETSGSDDSWLTSEAIAGIQEEASKWAREVSKEDDIVQKAKDKVDELKKKDNED